MTASLAPSPLTRNFCKRIMWWWNTTLQFHIWDQLESWPGINEQSTKPCLFLCRPNTKNLECDRNLLTLTGFKLYQYDVKEAEQLKLAEKLKVWDFISPLSHLKVCIFTKRQKILKVHRRAMDLWRLRIPKLRCSWIVDFVILSPKA